MACKIYVKIGDITTPIELENTTKLEDQVNSTIVRKVEDFIESHIQKTESILSDFTSTTLTQVLDIQNRFQALPGLVFDFVDMYEMKGVSAGTYASFSKIGGRSQILVPPYATLNEGNSQLLDVVLSTQVEVNEYGPKIRKLIELLTGKPTDPEISLVDILSEVKFKKADGTDNDTGKTIFDDYIVYTDQQLSTNNLKLTEFLLLQGRAYQTATQGKNIDVYYDTSRIQKSSETNKILEGDIIVKDNKKYIYYGIFQEGAERNHMFQELNPADGVNAELIRKSSLMDLDFHAKLLSPNYQLDISQLQNLAYEEKPSAVTKATLLNLAAGDIINLVDTNNTYFVVNTFSDLNAERVLVYDINMQSYMYIEKQDVSMILKTVKSNFDFSPLMSFTQIDVDPYNTLSEINLHKLSMGDMVRVENLEYYFLKYQNDREIQVYNNDTGEKMNIALSTVNRIKMSKQAYYNPNLHLVKEPTSFEVYDGAQAPSILEKTRGYKRTIVGDPKWETHYFTKPNGELVYDLSNYKVLENAKISDLNIGDMISEKSRLLIDHKDNKSTGSHFSKFYQVVSKTIEVVNNVEVIRTYVAHYDNLGNTIISDASSILNPVNLTFYSNDSKQIKVHNSTTSREVSLAQKDRAIINYFEKTFKIPVEFETGDASYFARTDGTSIKINLTNKGADNDYISNHAVHEFIHLMLANMRVENSEDYIVMLNVFKEIHTDLNLAEATLPEIEEALVEALTEQVTTTKGGFTLDPTKQSHLEKLISNGFSDLFKFNKELNPNNDWLYDKLGSFLAKYKANFFFESTSGFSLEAIERSNMIYKELQNIERKCV